MSEEDCLRPIRGDVWYFSTKSVARGVGVFVYRTGNLGIRLVEEIEDPVSDVPKYYNLHRGGHRYFRYDISGVAIRSYKPLGSKRDHIGFRLIEVTDE